MQLKKIFLVGVIVWMTACSGGGDRPKTEASWQREAKFRTFLNASVALPLDSSRHILDTLLKHYASDSVAMRQMVESLTPPLSDPNSEIRNEELYIPLLRAVIASPFYDSTEKIRPQYQLGMAMKNQVGHLAADFTYTRANGTKGKLYDLVAPYTLVYVNNPDCRACKEMMEWMVGSTVIANQLKTGKLKILAIYPDEDVAIWRKHLADVPEGWINGYDADLAIRRQELYDLRAIPSLYLLDRDKKVLLKDCTSVDMVEAYLVRNNH